MLTHNPESKDLESPENAKDSKKTQPVIKLVA